MPNFEPKKGKLYFVKTETKLEEVWTGFSKVHNHKTTIKPIVSFVDPENGAPLPNQEKFCLIPLLFLKVKRSVVTQKGHADIDHTDPNEGCFFDYYDAAYTRPGPPNNWDSTQHISADIDYEYRFLHEKQVIAVKIPADKSFGEFFHEATA